MAGHSKFKNIMHRKGAQDKQRAKIFTRLIRELVVATKEGLPDPDKNPRLRQAIQAARAANMPKDNIDRAIKRGSGDTDGENYEEIRYEGYGPNGVAVIVEALTDNRNRTGSVVRSSFSKYGGSLGETNSVSFMFDRVGQILYPKAGLSHDDLFEAALEAGADNLETLDDTYEVTTAMDSLSVVRDALEQKYGTPQGSKLIWKPKVLTALDEASATTLFKLLDALEESDDVQEIYANYDISDDIMEKLSQA